MATKYHFNKDTGRTGKCEAQIKCRLGLSDSEHFETREEAQAAFEKTMVDKTVHKMSKQEFSQEELTPRLDTVLDLDLLNKMIKSNQQYIMRNVHPDDDTLQVLCYGRSTQYEARWNDATKLARGLIVQTSKDDFSDAVIVQRPWKKFYTLSQVESGWSLGDEEDGASDSAQNELDLLDFDAPAEVTDKIDGSMGVLYRDPKGNLALSTKGSFTSEQAEYYTKFLRKNESMMESAETLMRKHPDTTFTFELVSSGEHQIVLDYDKDDIYLIGAINKSNGVYHSVNDYQKIWTPEKGLTSTETMSANNLREAFSLPDRENREGVVVRIISDDPEKQMQIKIKQDDYLKLHKLRTQFSKRDARETIRNISGTFGDLIRLAETEDVSQFSKISETLESSDVALGNQANKFYEKRLEYYRDLMIPRAKEIAKVKNYVESLSDDWFDKDERTAKKDFAQWVFKNKKEHGMNTELLMSFFGSRMKGENIDEKSANAEFRRMSTNDK